MADSKKDSFEKNVKTLEDLVKKLESGNLTLDDSLKAFEEGIGLTRTCEGQLKEAKTKIEKLIKKESGETEVVELV
ncbi:exodeoxyribonuclease VII small subunit [bacterium]|nr:exodeoxyribonuclease VII small subunit [bacterium]